MFKDRDLIYWDEIKPVLMQLIDRAALAQVRMAPNLDGDKDCKMQWRLSGIFGMVDMLKDLLNEGNGEKDGQEDV